LISNYLQSIEYLIINIQLISNYLQSIEYLIININNNIHWFDEYSMVKMSNKYSLKTIAIFCIYLNDLLVSI
jgi:hypothetical protein